MLALPGLNGAPVQMTVLACDAGGRKWALSYFDAGTPERWLRAPALWQAALEANVGALAEGKEGKSNGLGGDKAPVPFDAGLVPGSTPHPHASMQQARGMRPVSKHDSEPVVVNAMYFTKGFRVYQLSGWCRDEATSVDAWQTFVNSVHFLP